MALSLRDFPIGTQGCSLTLHFKGLSILWWTVNTAKVFSGECHVLVQPSRHDRCAHIVCQRSGYTAPLVTRLYHLIATLRPLAGSRVDFTQPENILVSWIRSQEHRLCEKPSILSLVEGCGQT